MAYEVLARKWRPQQFDQVVGQSHVIRTLQNAIESERVAHAYLFVGPRGVGKTSIARIMAKALNCATNRNGVPCDKCDSCREISQGNNLDVLEIDGASNTGVDNIRDLRDNVKFLPARGPFKVYIIDEVHMLSIGAFNALLKTLEEPPPHVKFIFATTEPQKVPATILSRCQRFDLRRISTGDIAAHLAKISKAEGVTIDDDAVYALARGAEGGLRDAESALDQVIAFRGKTISEEDVLSVFGLVSRRQLEALCAAVLSGSIPEALSVIAELDAAGKDLQRLASEVLDYFRHLLVMAYAPDVINKQEIPEHQWNIYREQAGSIDADRLVKIVELLILAQGQLKFALSRRVVIETALIRCARASRVATLDEIISGLRSAAGGALPDEPESTPATPRTASPAPRQSVETSRTETRPTTAQKKTSEPIVGSPDPAGELDLLTSHWPKICQKVGIIAPLSKSYVLDTRPEEITDVTCTIGCDPEFSGHLPHLQHPKCKAAFQHAIQDVIGRQITVHFQELKNGQAGQMPADIPVPSTPEKDNGAGDTTYGGLPPGQEVSAKRKWAEDPAVKRAMETFNGRISDIRQ
ncbi:MAG TPA: DNA polymerase III subunit gamma/tau [Kiritimatiellia bacterium]|nr:DNA polymerase III subunit gamma/tau [Kiritimatiellia bacterium]